MVPTGRTRLLDADSAWPVHMAFKRAFSALNPRLECQSRDQTRHSSSDFRAVRPPEGESSGSGSNHLRCPHKRTRQRGQGRASEFWRVSNQTKRRSSCQKSANGRCRECPTTIFCKFQAGQGNGSTGKETRRAPVSLEFVFYREALLLTDTYLFQQNACCFEKFYHRTARSCSVNSCSVNRNSMQRKTHKESSRWSADNHRDVPAQSRTKDNYLCEELTYSTETNDITDTGSAAR